MGHYSLMKHSLQAKILERFLNLYLAWGRHWKMRIAIFGVILGLAVGISGLPSGLSDVCAVSPCGRGATCQIASNIVSCNCPEGFTGDPFVECTSSRMQEQPHSHSETQVTTSFPMRPTVPVVQNVGSTAEAISSSTASRFPSSGQTSTTGFTTDYQISTDDFSRLPIRGSESTPGIGVTVPHSSITSTSSSMPSATYNQYHHPSVKPMTHGSSPGSMMGQHYQTHNEARPPMVASVANEYPIPHYNQNHGSQQRPHLDATNAPVSHNNYNQNQHNQAVESSMNNVVSDPMGKYSHCRTINGIIVCADNSVDDTFADSAGGNFGNHLAHAGNKNNDYHQSSNSNSQGFQGSNQPLKNYFDRNQPTQQHNIPSYHHSSTSHSGHSQLNHKTIGNPQTEQPYRENNDKLNSDSTDFCKSMCGINSVCRLVLGRPVCGCPEGHTGDPSVRCDKIENSNNAGNGSGSDCQRHTDCAKSQVCLKTQCVDPCDKNESSLQNENSHNGNMCGPNAKCMVIEHTPLCGCSEGFYGNPYVACVA